MKTFCLFPPVVGLAMLAASPVAAAAPPAPASAALSVAETDLLAAEDARFSAQIRKDVDAIAKGMADDMVYVHATGRRQTKAEYLDGLAHSTMTYASITASERRVKVWGNVGYTRAIYTIVVGDRTLPSSYLAVYVKREGRWQLLSWQTTPIQPQQPAAPLPPAPVTPVR